VPPGRSAGEVLVAELLEADSAGLGSRVSVLLLAPPPPANLLRICYQLSRLPRAARVVENAGSCRAGRPTCPVSLARPAECPAGRVARALV
jgi:hypothetical protein